jgi:hypothetical protein
VKLALVCCLVVACSSVSAAQASSPPLGQSVNVERLLKFSGTLNDLPGGLPGLVSLHFAMYDEPYGGEAYWQETQVVRPDTKGRYTVLLGESTLGGLPADIFESGRVRWLGVRASQELEQARVLLVETPSAWKPDPTSARDTIHEVPTGITPTERYITFTLLAMFLAGAAMAGSEAVKWWKARTERDGESPFANILAVPEAVWRASWICGTLCVDRFRSTRRLFHHSLPSIDALPHPVPSIEIGHDQQDKAA